MAESKKGGAASGLKDDFDNDAVQEDLKTETSDGRPDPTVKRVRDGECVIRLASAAGYKWETIWNLPDNKDAKEKRTNANTLLPGDRLKIPEVREKQESRATEAKHRFRALIEPSVLRLKLMAFDEPLANEPYVLRIKELKEELTGTTDADGKIEVKVPTAAEYGTLRVGEEPDIWEWRLRIGHLRPIETSRGVRQRLTNLGYAPGPIAVDIETNEEARKQFEKALRKFQRDQGLEETGRFDDDTKDALLKAGI